MAFAAELGEAILSASLQTMFDLITSTEFRDFLKSRKLDVSLLDKLKTILMMLSAVLNDAEQKQIKDPEVKKWLEELKDAVYDAEDLLDEIKTDSLRCKVKQDSQNNKVRSLVSSFISESYWRMNSKLKEICQRLQRFAEQKDILGLQSVSLKAHKTPTTSHVHEPIVVGREDDKEKLLNMLLCDEDLKGSDIGVITIWAIGGMGKTTLARLLYNDEKVQEHFDVKAWACGSDDFNVLEVTKSLVEPITSKAHDRINLQLLRRELRNSLSNRKFLFVLDDLWNDNYGDWYDLITPFRCGRRGSKIIVTTRQVVNLTHTFPAYELSALSDENCWCLLAKHALGNEDPNKYPELEAIGKQIARKCGGLPIAAKTIGGLLRTKVDARAWNQILNSSLWDLQNNDIPPALHLSYIYLPSHLKKCFAYCSIFPKDCLLEKKKLVLLWMAEGFVQQHSYGEKTLETEANDYFNELLSRSFIQQYEGDPKMFVMHDLINDLAQFVSSKSCLQFQGNEISKTARHLSFPQEQYNDSTNFESFYHLSCLRTLLSPSEFREWSYGFLTKKVPHDLLLKLKCLRALSLFGYDNVIEIPNSIGHLKHLRYLNLSSTSIRRLPDATFTLYNLQTLLLSNCHRFNVLPRKIGKLINLRHLDISGTAVNEMPTQITKLQNLQSLSNFMVGKQPNGLGIKELKNLPHLQGKLSILKLQNVVDSIDAFEVNLKRREKIEELVLEWDGDTQDSQIVKNVMDMLQPSTNLQRLIIKHYGGTSFPNWVGDSSFTKITTLCASHCSYCIVLPPFGQLPSLKELLINGMASVNTIGPEFCCIGAESSSFQPFPSLEILKFEKMLVWEKWIQFEGEGAKFPFPRLKQLYLHDCPMLKGDIPINLPSLRKVDVVKCNQLGAKLSALQWITSIEELQIIPGEQGLLRLMETEAKDPIPTLKKQALEALPAESQELQDEQTIGESNMRPQHKDHGETKAIIKVPHKINAPFDHDSLEAISKERVQEGPTSKDVMDLKTKSTSDSIMTDQQKLGEMTNVSVSGSIPKDIASMRTKMVTSPIYSQAGGSQSSPSTLTIKETSEASVHQGAKSDNVTKANLSDAIPSPRESHIEAVGPSPILEIDEILELLELKDKEEAALLKKALELHPQLRLSCQQHNRPIIALSYKVLIDILVILATKTPYTITMSDKLTLEGKLGDANFYGFDNDWIESVRVKVFSNDMSNVLAVDMEILVLEAVLESCDIALEQVLKRRVEAKERLQRCWEVEENELEAIEHQLLDLWEDRKKLSIKIAEFDEIVSAKDKPFGI